jgi:hypothetical protein
MFDVTGARQLLRRGETASSYLGDAITSIVTTTVSDDDLTGLSLDDELRILAEFEPDFYLLADAPTYTLDEPRERIASIQQSMTGTRWLAKQIDQQGIGTQLIPLVKGVTPPERAICYEMIETIDAMQCGFYASQYFGGRAGVQKEQLVCDLNRIDGELDAAGRDHELLVVGVLAPQTLKRLPERVTAAAGLQVWRSEVSPRTQSEAVIRERYGILADLIESALASSDNDQDGNGEQEATEGDTDGSGI